MGNGVRYGADENQGHCRRGGREPATVSRYLNNRPGQMTEETRARIAEVIERTGYRPRAAARNLRSSRTNLIGVILADIANPFSSAMLEGIFRQRRRARLLAL